MLTVNKHANPQLLLGFYMHCAHDAGMSTGQGGFLTIDKEADALFLLGFEGAHDAGISTGQV